MSSAPKPGNAPGTNPQWTSIPADPSHGPPSPFTAQALNTIRHEVSGVNLQPQEHQDGANPAAVNITKTTSTPNPSRSKHYMNMYIYWDLVAWNRLVARSRPTLREIFGLLDIATPTSFINTKGKFVFDDLTLNALNKDVCLVAANVPKDDGLPEMAANREILKEEKETLMALHGMSVWGRDKGRALVFEDPQDRAEIILHLHQWIFLKAFNSWRNIVDTKRKKDNGEPLVATSTKRSAQASPSHKAKKTKPQEFPRVSAGSIRALHPASKEPRDPFTDESDSERLFELAGHLVKYLHNKPDNITHKEFLTLLETHWRKYAPQYEKVFHSLYPVASHVLTSWIAERRNLIAFEDSIAEEMRLEDRFLAANDIRIKRVKWNHLSVQHHGEIMNSTDILCYTFATLTDSTGKGTLAMFRDGLAKLHGELGHVEGGNVIIELH